MSPALDDMVETLARWGYTPVWPGDSWEGLSSIMQERRMARARRQLDGLGVSALLAERDGLREAITASFASVCVAPLWIRLSPRKLRAEMCGKCRPCDLRRRLGWGTPFNAFNAEASDDGPTVIVP